MLDTTLLNKIKKVDWDVQRFNAYPLFISSVATLSGFKLAWGLAYTHFLCISHSKNVEWHYDKADYEKIGGVFWEKIKTVADLNVLIKEYRTAYELACTKAEYDEEILPSLGVDELKELLKLQIMRLYASAGIAHILECATYVCEHKLLKKYSIDPHTIKPSDLSFLRKAEIYAHELCDKLNDESVILSEFKKKYAWVQNSYLGRHEVTIDSIRKLARAAEGKENGSSLGPAAESDFVKIVSHLFSWQDERKAHILESIHVNQPVLDELARRLGIQPEIARFMLPEEADRITDPAFQSELIERSKLFVDYAPQSLKRTLCVGDEAKEFIEAFSTSSFHEGPTLQGATAFSGKVQGIVRVCLTMPSIESFKEGEILVASMTRPEYVSAMKKAAAFVTDEGGITCHAAIIAREMKKPCIIGTKIATKVLKDGDLVDVDAEKGIVTIIKRVE